ncbi:MAG: 2-dehydropantoate 2-reductase [Gammaproteobacteria bacterium]|jgi:2-dehydropantoate 2-reductase
MRFIIFGAGGVGGVIGAQLFKAKQDVVLIARGEHLRVMQTHGLRYETPFGDERLSIPAVGHPSELTFSSSDVVVLTCKSQHTVAALEALRRCAGVDVPVVCCQNGVQNEHMALRRFSTVYAMLVYLPAQLTEPGRIQCHAKLKSGVLDLGVFPSGVDATAQEISQRFEAVNFSVRPEPQIMRWKYAKLLANLNNALEAVTPRGPGVADIKAAMKAEGVACLTRAGIDFASDDEVKERRDGVFALGDIPGVERVGGSSRQSLLRGTGDIEADYLNGEIVKLGREFGVSTPINTALTQMAVELADSGALPEAFSFAELETRIARAAR